MKSNEILRQFLARKKEQNPSYSMRALARDNDFSPAFMSSLINGKKKIPAKALAKLIKTLDLDSTSAQALRQSIAIEQDKLDVFKEFQTKKASQSEQSYRPLPKNKISLLTKWYYVAVLDLMTCSNFKSDIQWVSRRLGLLPSEVGEALEVLEKLKLISKSDSEFSKNSNKLRFTTTQSQQEIRNYHKQMIQKSMQELEFKTTENDFEKRLITGITLSVKKEKIELAKQKFSKVIHEIASELIEDDGTELYQLNLQLFPLTKDS